MKDLKNKLKRKIERTPIYSILKGIAWIGFHTVFPLKVINKQGLEMPDAPYLIVANHSSVLDSALLGLVCPYELHGLGKKELIRDRFTKWFFEKCLHIIPVARHEFDVKAIRTCIARLKEKRVLCIFPEGTRKLETLMERVEKGAALLAMRQRVDIIPVYLEGKYRLFRPVRAIVGEPIRAQEFPEGAYSDEKAEKVCERIREVFYKLRDKMTNTSASKKETAK